MEQHGAADSSGAGTCMVLGQKELQIEMDERESLLSNQETPRSLKKYLLRPSREGEKFRDPENCLN